MKIYTKTGDKGTTSLIGGTRVCKDDARIEAYGTLDELSAFVAVLRDDENIDSQCIAWLDKILGDLLSAESCLALEEGSEVGKFIPKIKEEDVEWLEKIIDEISEDLPPLKTMILFGGDMTASRCHVCRTVCRRAERRIITLAKNVTVDDTLMRYVNRLSDFFFTLSRHITRLHGRTENIWKSTD